jgi:type VI secretion system protein ImpK
MSDDDPFGLNDRDRTQIARPQPGGRGPARPAGAPAAAPHTPLAATGAALPAGTPGRGPLVETAFGILALAPLLRSRTPPTDPETLRAQIERELARFMEAARGKGLEERVVSIGHYCLCALVDDIVLNTPWGAHGTWRSRSLAGTLHHDVAAGERFFDYLDQAKRQPERNRPILELMAACLAMGFEGRYRIVPHGQSTLQQLRAELAAILSKLDGETPAELSGHWQGVSASHVPITQRIPFWVYGAAALLFLGIVYAAFALRLGGIGERLDTLVAGLPPAGPVTIVRQAAAVPTPPPPPPAAVAIAPELLACLPEQARAAEDAVVEDLEKVRVRLPNAGLFASGRADLEPEIEPVLLCLGGILDATEGQVMVLGHSDNVPIRTARFPSNWELSKARADSVAVVLGDAMADQSRLAVEGRSDTQPVASNATPEGRARNRRVEIVLLK